MREILLLSFSFVAVSLEPVQEPKVGATQKAGD
jgi:hypothetical protein